MKFPPVSCLTIDLIVSHPIGATSHSRRKDRLSYSHEEFKIDLTQVTSTTSPNSPVRAYLQFRPIDAD